MSNDEQEDEVNLVLPYVVSEPTSSPQRNKFGKISRLTEAERLRHDAIKNLNIDPITYPHTIHRKRHVGKKSLFATSHDDISMSTSSDSELFTDDPLYDEERDLIPKLLGQTTHDIKAPTRQVFEYVYKNFTDSSACKYLENIQPWLYFR